MQTIEAISRRMEANLRAIRALLEEVDERQARWKPMKGEWSILEVVTHLADEEVEDFRTRVRLLLEDPSQDWPPIDPDGWAVERGYNEGDLEASMARFSEERAASVAWLRGLKAPDWDRSRRHPAGFSLRAGDLMSAWLAHDQAHIHQLAALQAAWLTEARAPYDPRYAGWEPFPAEEAS